MGVFLTGGPGVSSSIVAEEAAQRIQAALDALETLMSLLLRNDDTRQGPDRAAALPAGGQ